MAKSKLTREEQIEHILEEVANNRGITEVCRQDEGMPRLTTFLRWVQEDATLRDRYACAKEARIEQLLEETLQIADDVTNDAYIHKDPKTGRTTAKIDGFAARRAEVIIATREKYAKMMMPERFNTQRTDITSGGKALPAPQHNDNRIVALLALAAERAAALTHASGKAIDITPTSIDDVMS